MNKTTWLLASIAAITLSAPSFAADKETYNSSTKIEKDSKGNYEEKDKTSATDTAGTTTAEEKTVDVDVDRNGDTEKTVTTKHSTDPKGLFNKQTTKTTDKTKIAADGSVKTSHKKKVNGKTVEDTTEASPAAGSTTNNNQ